MGVQSWQGGISDKDNGDIWVPIGVILGLYWDNGN